MKTFLSPDGSEYNLANVPNTSFWTDRDGDLYQIEGAQCFPISAYSALDAILSREKFENAYCPLCERGRLKSNVGQDSC